MLYCFLNLLLTIFLVTYLKIENFCKRKTSNQNCLKLTALLPNGSHITHYKVVGKFKMFNPFIK